MSLPPQAPDRSPPHSAEAEEHVIACCLLDGDETVTRCQAHKVTPESFYFPANRLLFETVLKLHGSGRKVMLETLAEELKTTRQLESVGGFAYLMQVTGKIPTTAHAGYFIEKVVEKHVLRESIKAHTAAIEEAYGFTGGLDEYLKKSRDRVAAVEEHRGYDDIVAKPLTDFLVPPDDDPSILLGNRYLNRGDGALLVSTSGMGKSSISLQMAALWAVGKPAFGIQPNCKPGTGLRSVVIQAEDSEGDIGEVWSGVLHELKFTPEEVVTIKQNVLIIEERIARGDSFLIKLRAVVRKFKPDLVWINPLLAFADGDTTKAEVMGKFLREGLNGINAKKEFAYFIIHHTPKPPQADTKGKGTAKKWNEVMYEGAGSADLTNWARAIMVLKATETEGEFDLVLAKRGKRAGVVIEVEQGAGVRLEATNVISLKHAEGTITIPGRAKPLSVICWLPRTATPAAGDAEEAGTPMDDSCLPMLEYYPPSSAEPESYPAICRYARETQHIVASKFEETRKELLRRGLVIQTEDKRYRRSEAGDVALDNFNSPI